MSKEKKEKEEDNYLEQLRKAYDYSTAEFDKSLTYISSGMLTVSFAFIENIIPLKDAKHNKEDLIFGWYTLTVAIFISVLAHYLNIFFLKWIINIYKPEDDEYQRRVRNGCDYSIQAMNIITLLLILIGSLKIIYFVKTNIILN